MLSFVGGKLHEMAASGEFWIAGEHQRKFSGRLEVDRLGSSTLFLRGKKAELLSLDERKEGFHIFGIANGTPVTLFDCFNVTSAPNLALSPEAKIITNLTLTDAHLSSMETKHFDAMEFEPDGLSEWTGLRGFVEKIKTPERFTIEYRKTNTRPIALSDDINLSFRTHAILEHVPAG